MGRLVGVYGGDRGQPAGVDNYTLVLNSQIGITIGQPFILNALTKVAAFWFPIQERATASGFGSLAMYLGISLVPCGGRPAGHHPIPRGCAVMEVFDPNCRESGEIINTLTWKAKIV